MTLRLNNQQNNSANIDYADQVGGADSTITIPQGNGTVAMVGAGGGLGGNISRATIFRLNQNHTADQANLRNWEVPDQAGETIGVGGSVSTIGDGSVFEFPVTGVWLVQLHVTMTVAESDSQATVGTQFTTDGGTNWSTRAQANAGATDTGGNLMQASSSNAVIDVTDTANVRIRFRTATLAAGGIIHGNTSSNVTSVLFLRLGDTP